MPSQTIMILMWNPFLCMRSQILSLCIPMHASKTAHLLVAAKGGVAAAATFGVAAAATFEVGCIASLLAGPPWLPASYLALGLHIKYHNTARALKEKRGKRQAVGCVIDLEKSSVQPNCQTAFMRLFKASLSMSGGFTTSTCARRVSKNC